jgi:hypothetical protein
MSFDLLAKDAARRIKRGDRGVLVTIHQPRVPAGIRRQDRGQRLAQTLCRHR